MHERGDAAIRCDACDGGEPEHAAMQIGDRACKTGELLGHLRDQLGLPPLVFLQADHAGGELVRGRRDSGSCADGGACLVRFISSRDTSRIEGTSWTICNHGTGMREWCLKKSSAASLPRSCSYLSTLGAIRSCSWP